MKRNKFHILAILVLVVSLALMGCSTTETMSEVKVESGVIDSDYTGVVCPEVSKDYKISEESKDGMVLVTIKCGVQKEIPASDSEAVEGDADETKPKI